MPTYGVIGVIIRLGIRADELPGYFTVIDAHAPVYTEPYWGELGLKIRTNPTLAMECASLAVGIAILGISISLARHIRKIINSHPH